jgi:hypothetical protein
VALKLTVVVNGVANEEQAGDEGNDGLAGLVLAREIASLDATSAGGGVALGEFRVELYERSESGAGSS